MNNVRRLLYLIPLVASLTGCTKHHAEDDEGEATVVTPVVSVRTAPVVRGNIDVVVAATGTTDAVRKEKVVAPISGVLVSLNVLEGTPVRRGDVVAVIQPKETRAAITGAETLLREATTEKERGEARRAMDLARRGANNLEVRATSDAVVASRSVTEGEVVAEGADLLTLVDLRTLDFIADVPLQDIDRVHRGEKAGIVFQSLPGRRFAAFVEAVNPRSDAQSQTVRVRLAFAALGSERSLLRTDMGGVAGIVTGVHSGVLIVPKEAVLRNDETNASTIVVATPDSVARIVPVDVGARTDSTAEVSGAGLAPGVRVVVEGNYALADSTRIAPAE